MSVAAKFLNTYMHQLTKYREAYPLVPVLHLPLDARVMDSLRRLRFSALDAVRDVLGCSPYALPYKTHLKVQRALTKLIVELNARRGAEFQMQSRIELNWLWLRVRALPTVLSTTTRKQRTRLS